MFKSKVKKIEANKKELSNVPVPKKITKELYRVTVNKITRTMKEDTDDRYYDVLTKKEVDWNAYYKADESEETKGTVLKLKIPNGEFRASDASIEIFDQQHDTLDVQKLVLFLNQSEM